MKCGCGFWFNEMCEKHMMEYFEDIVAKKLLPYES